MKLPNELLTFYFIFSLIAHKCYSVPAPLSQSGLMTGKTLEGGVRKLTIANLMAK